VSRCWARPRFGRALFVFHKFDPEDGAMLGFSVTIILGVLAAFVQIFFGFLYYLDRLRPCWSPLRRGFWASLLTLAVVLLSAWAARDKILVEKRDLFELRQIADSAYKKADYDVSARTLKFALRFDSGDEDLHRRLARSYKRLGDYRAEIEERKIAFRLNPSRDENHLAIIEDYILLKEYDNAETWILFRRPALSR
jgi:tetratricopeptide (TPR) repeat protein